MSLKFLFQQGRHLVVRDESGRIVKGGDGEQQRALAPRPRELAVQTPRQKRETFRKHISRLTDGGKDIYETMISLMHGNVHVPTGKDPVTGEMLRGEPQWPSPEVRRAAAKDLHEMLNGKAVAETEVNNAEEEAAKRMQLESMSEEQLLKLIEGEAVDITDNDAPLPSDDSQE